MDQVRWVVFVVVNHTRREIVVDGCPLRASSARHPAHRARGADRWRERNVARSPLVGRWDFREDRMKVLSHIPAVDERDADRRARALASRSVKLDVECPRAAELAAHGYRILAHHPRGDA